MGDYSVGHFNFTLKRKAPKEIVETVESFIREGTSIKTEGGTVYRGDSAYHHDKCQAFVEPPQGYLQSEEGNRYVTTFQVKYGCEQIRGFAKYIAPHVVVDSTNRGFVGYKISEYADTVTTFIVGADGKLKD